MIKFRYFLFLFLTYSTFSFAQNCNCESNFKWVKKTFEENDAGFKYAIEIKGIEAYKAHNEDILKRIQNINSKDECTQTIYDWIKFFRSGHFEISLIEKENSGGNNNNFSTAQSEPISNSETVKINQNNFEKYLSTKKNVDIEGIWETEPYLIGIKKIGNEYKGFIIKSGAENWKPNEVKLKIDSDQKTGTYFLRNKSSQKIESLELLGKNYLKINDFYLKRISPKYEEENTVSIYMKSINATKPYLDQLNKSTLILRIPSFDGSEKTNIDSVLIANKQKIESTENLIIDLRNNGGGSDASYSNIIPYLYTNPIRNVETVFYSTKLNNEKMRDVYENYQKYGLKESERKTYKDLYDKLEKNLGKFVSTGTDKNIIRVQKLDKAYPFPKNIGIIINNYNASTTEEFLLAAKQSKKVKLFGITTAGILDFSNMYFVDSPCKEYRLGYATSKSMRLPEMAVDGKGISPDYYIDKSIPEHEWINFVDKILNEK